jgi:hypothetical protein
MAPTQEPAGRHADTSLSQPLPSGRRQRDPAASCPRHKAIDSIVDSLIAGLRKGAEWTEPPTPISSQP